MGIERHRLHECRIDDQPHREHAEDRQDEPYEQSQLTTGPEALKPQALHNPFD